MSDRLERRIEELEKTFKEIMFTGIKNPDCTQVPDMYFDLMPCLTGAGFKVLMYIIRRTFGFKKNSANISISQIAEGTGLSKQQVINTIKVLENSKIIKKIKFSNPKNGTEVNTYCLV